MMQKVICRGLQVGVLLSISAWTHADTLSDVRDRVEFLLGHRESSSPFSFVSEKGEAMGYSVDICLNIYEQIKRDLKRPGLKVKYVPLKPADRITAVKAGQVDVECGSTTHTVDRQKDVAFSYTTFVTGARLLAKKSANIKALTDLKGKSVMVTEKTTTEKVLRQVNAERNLDLKIITAKDHAEGFSRLVSGEALAVANDDALLFGLVTKSSDPQAYDFVGKYVSVEPYGIMYRKDDPGFAKLVDLTVASLFSTGRIRGIYAKWFESGSFKLPMNQYMKENVKIPNRYGVQ